MNGISESHEHRLGDWPLVGLAALLIAAFAAVSVAMTPYTYQLDSIKRVILLVSGPLLMVGALGLLGGRRVSLPPALLAALAGWLFVMVLLSLRAPYAWAAGRDLLKTWSAAGYFLAAACLGSSRRGAETFLRGAVLVLLVVNLIGFFMFDPPGGDPNQSLLSQAYQALFATAGPGDDAPRSLLSTLSNADGALQSTILNSAFYAAYCVFFYPLALLLALDAGPGRGGLFWRVVGLVAALASSASIFFACSILPLIAWLAISLAFLAAVGARWVGANDKLRRTGFAIAGLPILCVATLGFVKPGWSAGGWAVMKDLELYKILWGGAFGIFAAHPLLGGGPGSFLILFPAYRRPDYFDFGISNVTTSAHSLLLNHLAETGLVGVAALCILAWVALAPGIGTIFRGGQVRPRSLLLAALSAVGAILIVTVGSPIERWEIGATTLWMIFGFATGMAAQSSAAARPASLPSPYAAQYVRRGCFVAAALGLVVFPLSAQSAINQFRAEIRQASGLVIMNAVYERLSNQPLTLNRADAIQMMRESAGAFEEVLRRDPFNYSAGYKLGSVRTNLSELERDWADTSEKAGELITAGEHQARADENLDRAREAYEQLARLAPDYAEIHYNLSIVYGDRARRERRKADAATDPAEANNRAAMAGRYEELALTHCERMSSLSLKREVAVIHGQYLMELQRYKQASVVFRAALERYPNDKELSDLASKADEMSRPAATNGDTH
jgi:hypothetical protein